ncbi:hypothetical protein K501DRAFT_329656 [Backusella circina FSU 941]|nr:hypothetical protein K501DRAFT_329656 [Backusella circina FSU 941]
MDEAGVPIWAIVIIVVLVIVCALFTAYFVRHRRNKRKTDTKVASVESLQTLVTNKKIDEKKGLNPANSVTVVVNETPLLEKNYNNKITDEPASMTDESQHDFQSPPEPPQEIKISLPLPPPSTCFFSDKMELNNSQTHDFYDMFVKKNEKTSQDGGFVSIDLDIPSFYANTAANLQQKAATLKSTLRQSLRRQKSKNKASAQNLFSQQDERKNSGEMVTQKKTSYEYQPPECKEPLNQNKAISESTNKIIIQSEEDVTNYSTKNGTLGRRAMLNLQTAFSQIEEPEEDSPMTPNTQQEPVRAAKKVIRTASKKTKTRSMIVNEGSAEEQVSQGQDLTSEKTPAKHGSVRYASFRGPRSNGEHITLTTGSMRRMVRQSVVYDEALAIPPQMASVSGKSTSNRASRGPAASVLDIAGWWDTPKSQTVATDTKIAAEDGTGSVRSESGPSQYRASLASSVLVLNGTLSKSSGNNVLNGTLSKSSASLLGGSLSKSNGSSLLSIGSTADKMEDNPTGNNTFRRSTLGRNTLRSLRANATNGVNRSLKGLFDYSSANSSKVAPEDSQKMELSTDSVPDAIEPSELPAYINTDPYASTRKKSIRASVNANKERPAIPTNYLPSSESSTKYALSDDEENETETDINEIQPSSKQEISNIVDNPVQGEKEPDIQQKAEPPSGEVHNIRRMLQDTWINNMKESGSMFSISSDTDSVLASPTSESSPFLANSGNKIIPRQQNQSLLTKSLLTQQVKRTSQVLKSDENGFIPQQGPEPSASFSSSTVRTVVPAHEMPTEPINIRQNAVTSSHYAAHGSNKYQESSYDERKSSPNSRFSTSPNHNNNNSAESSRGHSRKSSGGNSTATALRISAGYAANAKTWNGRTHKRPSVTQFGDTPQETGFTTPQSPPLTTPTLEPYGSVGKSSYNKRAFFSTMRKGQKNRGAIPWMEEEKTPAQRERDRYLEGKS